MDSNLVARVNVDDLLSQNSKEAAKCPLPHRLPEAKCLGDGNYCLPITRTIHRPDFHCSK